MRTITKALLPWQRGFCLMPVRSAQTEYRENRKDTGKNIIRYQAASEEFI